ncbi:MAG TPA: DNRLRE domain-containing protein [Frankiaceae bacterium]|nr:DNRLRE domain-containing protein [Frankiaceae bacterium]
MTVTSTRGGFEQSVVLHERPKEPVTIRLPLRLRGLRATQEANGTIRLRDAAGKVLVTTPPARMWGAKVDEHTGGPTREADVTTALVQTRGGAEIVLTPSPAFLADPSVEYPVTVDPGPSLGLSTDTWVDTSYSQQQRYSTELRAGTYDGTNKAYSLLKFDTTPITGATVDSATLNLYEYHSWSCQERVLEVRRVMDAWDPDTATWANRPGLAATVYGSTSTTLGHDVNCPDGWINVPGLNDLFQLWASGSYANNGLALKASDTDVYAWKRFYSANQGGNVVPSLSITYRSVPSAPTDVVATSGNNEATVTWADPDDEGGSSLNGFVVKRSTVDSSGNVLATGSVTVDETVHSYTSSAVTNNQRVYFEISAKNTSGTGPAKKSNTVVVGTPTEPRRIDAVPGYNRATVLWDPPANYGGASISSYNVKREIIGGTIGQVSVPSTQRAYTSSAVHNGEHVKMSVQACNSRGCGEWAVAREIVPIDPLGLAGDRGYFSYDSRSITDRVQAKVNLSTGNLMVSVSGLSVSGTTRDLQVGQTYNSLSQFVSNSTTDVDGNPTWTTGVLGKGWRLSTDTSLKIISDGSIFATFGAGGTDYYKKNTDGSFTGPKSAKADLTGGGSGDSTYKLTFHGSGQILRFDASGRLTSDSERSDRTDTRFTIGNRNAAGNPTTITGTRGPSAPKSLTLAYNTAGRLSSIQQTGTDSQARDVVFSTDANDDLRSITDPNEKTTYFDYNASHDLTKITTPDGKVTSFAYDVVHRVTTIWRDPGGPDQSITSYDWRSTPSRNLVTDGRGNVTRYAFDEFDLITATRDPAGHLRSKSYTPFNDVASFSSSTAGTTTNEFGANGGESMTKSTGPSSAQASMTYNSSTSLTKFLPSAMTDAAGDQKQFTYDGPGNVTGSTDSAGAESYVERNDDGTVGFTTDPEQKGKTHTPASDCTRDNNTVDNCWAYKYDNSDKNLTRILPPNGAGNLGTRTFGYDRYNRISTVTVGGVTVTTTFDDDNRAVKREYSDLRPTVQYEYYDDGQLKKRTDETGITTFTYDNLGRLKSKTQGTNVLSYAYDPNGNMTGLTDGRGTTSYAYNSRNLLSQITEAGSGRKVLFGYDHDSKRTDTYYNTSGTNGGAAAHDAEGDLLPPAAFTAHIEVELDKGDLKRIKTTRRSLDTDPNRVSDYSYAYTDSTGKNVGRRTSVTDNVTGIKTTYSYDNGRLTGANAATGSDYYYCYDKNGNRKWEGSAAPSDCGSVTAQLAFDSANQVTTPGWDYDASGNATSIPGVGALAYNGLDFTTSVTPSGGLPTPFTYAGIDQAERYSAGTDTFSNGLTGVQSRTSAVPTQTAYFERDPNGTLVSMVVGTNEYYVAFDGLGSVVALIDVANGNVVGRYAYDPYGVTTVSAGEASSTSVADLNPWRYVSGYYDAQTGLMKFGLRYYDAAHGRFTQRDPMAQPPDPSKANSYAYASDNPVNFIDPSGADAEDWGTALEWIGTGIGLVSSVLPNPITGLIVGTIGSAIQATGTYLKTGDAGAALTSFGFGMVGNVLGLRSPTAVGAFLSIAWNTATGGYPWSDGPAY